MSSHNEYPESEDSTLPSPAVDQPNRIGEAETLPPQTPITPRQQQVSELPSKPTTATPRSRSIGPYKLMQKLGEGGMGEVWMAEQSQPVRRRVAVKLIKVGLDNKQILARFDAERQALAMMDHQNIAKVLDTGTTAEGAPYFVMELVHGIPFTTYCDKNKLSINERLELFIPVCKAIQHAHQKGIIHRDLKPSNVLVSLYDGKPVPKVIDFGLAKALENTTKLTDKTIFTEFGQVVGTLQYMSPEQAEMNQLDIDTRTDIYSLGVMLYELLTGSTPIQADALKQQAILHVLTRILEQEPPRPSVRLSSTNQEVVSGISVQRRIDPGKLKSILRGDLDWIVMKAIEKDRARRYETANGFAEDITRYLSGEVVTARPPSTGYRLQKYIRRNKGLVVGLSSFFLMLCIGMIGTAIFTVNTFLMQETLRNEKKRAERNAREAKQSELAAVNFAKKLESKDYASQLALAQSQWLLGDGEKAEWILNSTNPDRRGWEHGYLSKLVNPSSGRFHNVEYLLQDEDLQQQFSLGVNKFACFCASPCGEFLAGSYRITWAHIPGDIVTVWEAKTGAVKYSFWTKDTSKGSSIVALTFSPDSRQLIGGSNSGEIMVWDTERGIESKRIGLAGSIRDICCWKTDLVVVCGEKLVSVLNFESGEVTLSIEKDYVKIAVCPQTSVLAGACEKDTLSRDGFLSYPIELLDLGTGELVRTSVGHTRQASDLSFEESGKYLFSAASGNGIRLQFSGELFPYETLYQPIPNANEIAIWETQTGELRRNLRGHQAAVHRLVYDSARGILASGGTDRQVLLWKIDKEGLNEKIRDHEELIHEIHVRDSVNTMCLLPGSEILINGYVWSYTPNKIAFEGRDSLTFEKGASRTKLQFINNEKGLLGSRGYWVFYYDMVKGKSAETKYTLPRVSKIDLSNEETFRNDSYSSDQSIMAPYSGNWFATVFGKLVKPRVNNIEIRTWADEAPVRTIETGTTDSAKSLAVSEDGRWLMVSWDAEETPAIGAVTLYCLEPELKKLTLPANRTECVLLSRNGDKAVTVSQRPERIFGQSERQVVMWDTATQRVLWSADAPSRSFREQICWSSDFKSIALVCSGASTGAVRLYNSADGEFRDMKNAETASSCVTFTPDGKRVLAGSMDGTVHIWDSESGEKVFEFQAQEGEVGSLLFTREDATLYTAGDGGVKFWVSQ